MVASLAVLEIALAAGCVYSAWVMRDLVNAAAGGMSDALLTSVVVFAAVSVAIIAVQALQRFLRERVQATFQNTFKMRLFDEVLHADLANSQARSQGMAAKVDHIADRVDLLYKESAR